MGRAEQSWGQSALRILRIPEISEADTGGAQALVVY